LNQWIPRVSQSDLADHTAETSANFYTGVGKRSLDIAVSGIALILVSPLLVILAACIKATSRGPVFFCQERVGRGGSRFNIVKFRTMVADANSKGPAITVGGDARVTRVGTVFRKYKLDELPQLWNVLKGEMSLVGPRPELPIYVALYTPAQVRVLSVRPGITDPASIAYRHEETVLAQQSDPERHYREDLLPQKLTLSLHYVKTLSFSSDMLILWQTVTSLFREPSADASPHAN
jgi:lipopolysaccharide/colanic/teichoic acid biosynthesis glycosyltransferase